MDTIRVICMLCCFLLGFNYCWTDSDKSRQQKIHQLLDSLSNYTKPNEMDQFKKNSSVKAGHPSFAYSVNHLSSPLSSSGIDIQKPLDVQRTTKNISTKSYHGLYRELFGTGKDSSKDQRAMKLARADLRTSRDVSASKLDEILLANEHYLKILTKAKCKIPVPQIIRVKDYYPDPSKEYLPRCTQLHRCGDASGCCENDALKCVPGRIQEVVLYFYVLIVGKNGLGYAEDGNGIQMLSFQNHTSCRCEPINDFPRIMKQPNKLQTNILNENDAKTPITKPRLPNKCQECPVPFNTRLYRDGRCGCDCFDRQKPCLKIKKGRDPLPEIERRCVVANHCHIPDCEYGIFDSTSGYCPKRHDETPRASKGNQQPAHHRWTFFERD